MSSHRTRLLFVVAVLACFLSFGCATKQQRLAERAVSDYFAGDYRAAVEQLRPLAMETNENFVLNNVRLGSAALVGYELNEAEAAFLRAYEVMNAVGVNDGGRTLGALLVDEKVRIWRGEPFERAMANFYLGLIYYMRADYNNARAAFENALFKLRDYGEGRAERDEYREIENNFALAYLMLGKTWQKLGREDLALANFQRVVELRPALRHLADYELNKLSNLLLVVDYGYGPQKVTEFDGSVAAFAPTPWQAGPVPLPQVFIDGAPMDMEGRNLPPVDLLALAQDRRWQSIDTVRAVKSAVGTGLIVGGAYQTSRGRYDSDRTVEGLALIGAGLLMKATSQADVRQWEMLPRTTFVIPLVVPPGVHDVTVTFPRVPGQKQTWRNIVVPEEGEAVYYMRMRRWSPAEFDWPPPALAEDPAGSDEVIGHPPAAVQ